MRIILDNIIFSLQKSGGGSMYWYEIVNRFNKSNNDTSFIDYKNSNSNIFRRLINLQNTHISRIPISIARIMPDFSSSKSTFIYHSSYYRFSLSKKAINVTTIHDFTPEKFFSGFSRFASYWQKKIAILKSDGIICISENTKKDLLSYHPTIDSAKIRVIYNGVSDDFYKINNITVSDIDDKEVEDCLNKKYAIYVGHRTNYKNFFVAVEAMAAFSDNMHFVIVGEPLTELEKNRTDNILSKRNYTVLSKKNIKILNLLYNKAFCLIYPSSYEGFGIPILEAMKTGCPVITTTKSSIPEVAGEAAIMIKEITVENLVNAINSLQNTDFRNNLIEKGYLQAQKFSWNKCYEEVQDFYKQLYSTRKK